MRTCAAVKGASAQQPDSMGVLQDWLTRMKELRLVAFHEGSALPHRRAFARAIACRYPTEETPMFTLTATLTAHMTRQVTELALLLALLGGIAVGIAAVDRYRRWSLLAAAALFVIGFALAIYGLHFGMNPYHVLVVKK